MSGIVQKFSFPAIRFMILGIFSPLGSTISNSFPINCHCFPTTTPCTVSKRKMRVNTLNKIKSMGILYRIMYVLTILYILPLQIDINKTRSGQ